MGKILSTKVTEVSPWLQIVEKRVQLEHRDQEEEYHFVSQQDYVGVFAVSADGAIPLVRQYRPCVEAFTLEFPAGTVDPGESADAAARRELLEEVGMTGGYWHRFKPLFPDTGRLALGSTAYFVRGCELTDAFEPEQGVEVVHTDAAGLKQAIAAGTFNHQLHLAIIGLAIVQGLFSF